MVAKAISALTKILDTEQAFEYHS